MSTSLYLSLTDEQAFLVEAATDALSRTDTVAGAREALDGAAYPDAWSVAVDAGWTGILTGEDADGAGLGAYEALLVLEACGERLADARLLGHLPACALLEHTSHELRAPLASGELRAALVDATNAERSQGLISRPGRVMSLDGEARLVPDADGADVFVVVAEQDGEPVCALVRAGAAGLTVTPRRGYDATRNLADVRCEGVEAERLDVPAERVRSGADLQRALLAAESVGSADRCLAMAREYALDRHAFGRAIGSYQAIKHKLVEMLRRTEGARSLVVHAGRAWDEDAVAFAVAANAARVSGADALGYASSENIFIHGGVGATWEGDPSLFYRRAELSRRLLAGSEQAADELAGLLFASAREARGGTAPEVVATV